MVAFGRSREYLTRVWARVGDRDIPSAEVIQGMEDERVVRKMRRRMRFWRLFRRVR